MKQKEIIIYDSNNEASEYDWDDFKYDFSKLLKQDSYIITGYFGSWRGNLASGTFIHDINDLINVLQHLDYIQIKDSNGHLMVTGSHHDGSDNYEIKRLTNKGYELASKNNFAKNRKLHNAITNNNFYSSLPKYAQKVYGI